MYDLPDVLDETFDVVYTSRGVLGWLPDIAAWARVVARYVRPGGRFFITEVHPIAQVFEPEGVAPGELRLAYPYWEHPEPLIFEVKGSYADPSADVGEQREHGWDHGLGEIVTALIEAGLRIERLEEHAELDWSTDFLVESAPGSDTLRAAAGHAGLAAPGVLAARDQAGLIGRTLPRTSSPSAGLLSVPGRATGRKGRDRWSSTPSTSANGAPRSTRGSRRSRPPGWAASPRPSSRASTTMSPASGPRPPASRARTWRPGTLPRPPRPGREPKPTKDERKRSRPSFGD